MGFGKRISELRKAKGFSQEELAAHLGVSRQAVSRWENELSLPDTENLICLSRLLDVELSILNGDDGETEQPGPAEAEEKERPSSREWWKKILVLALLCAVVLFFALWNVERSRVEKLELLCRTSASHCLSHLVDYAADGKDPSFYGAVSEFRCFMQSYHLLTENTSANGNYTFLSEVYGCMLCAPERIEEDLDALISAMELLAQDIYDHSGHNLMYGLYIQLRHG